MLELNVKQIIFGCRYKIFVFLGNENIYLYKKDWVNLVETVKYHPNKN